MDQISVVGGGLAGLIAATEAAEAGGTDIPVHLLEARTRLGGRARSLPGPFQANLGPHALYAGTALWDWLVQRDLHRPFRRTGLVSDIRFRRGGELRRTPSLGPAWRMLRYARRPAPVDVDLRTWATELVGEDGAQTVIGAAGPLVFDHDPGRLSAAFVVDKIRRILIQPRPVTRYVEGGWTAMVERMATHARYTGVTIETGARLDPAGLADLAGKGPVIVALDPSSARRLLEDDGLRPESPRVALLDLGLDRRRGDPYAVFDLDEAVFVERFTYVVPSLAPEGHELVQASVGVRPDDGLESGVARLEAVVDLAFAGWRDRVTWQRRGLVTESTGALDMPGSTWRDRTPVAYADGVWLAGDWVAAPGHLAEVSCTSAIRAAQEAVAAVRRSSKAPVPTS